MELRLGIKNSGYYGLSIVSDENRALKKHDFWYAKERRNRSLRVENRFSHLVFDIPLRCLSPNIRRYAGLKKFDITDETDYTIINAFDQLTDFLEGSDIENAERKHALKQVNNGEWETFVKSHSSKFGSVLSSGYHWGRHT